MQAIKDSPRYLKFFQDSKKNKDKLKPTHNMHYKSVLALQACSLPEKKCDLEVPYVSCVINRGIIRKSLLDLGSSINLMPYALYKKLDFTDLIPCPIRLHMANNAVVEPLGMIEDVIVQVGEAFYPTDFIVLELESGPAMEHSLILGRPWLATAKAKIASLLVL